MMHCARGEMEMEMEGASGVESGAKNMSYKCKFFFHLTFDIMFNSFLTCFKIVC